PRRALPAPPAPYPSPWPSPATNNGAPSWPARAYDAAANSPASAAVGLTVSVNTVPPTVSITSPAATTYTAAQTVTITASASDNVGVTRVEFYDGATLMGTVTSAPYTFAWSFTATNNGAHSWSARAYRPPPSDPPPPPPTPPRRRCLPRARLRPPTPRPRP